MFVWFTITLIATILGDSICLSEEAGKVRPLDIQMIEKLEQQLNITSTEDRAEVFRQICSAKENVSGENYYQYHRIVMEMSLILNNPN